MEDRCQWVLVKEQTKCVIITKSWRDVYTQHSYKYNVHVYIIKSTSSQSHEECTYIIIIITIIIILQ